jgi:hypothetical protein
LGKVSRAKIQKHSDYTEQDNLNGFSMTANCELHLIQHLFNVSREYRAAIRARLSCPETLGDTEYDILNSLRYLEMTLRGASHELKQNNPSKAFKDKLRYGSYFRSLCTILEGLLDIKALPADELFQKLLSGPAPSVPGRIGEEWLHRKSRAWRAGCTYEGLSLGGCKTVTKNTFADIVLRKGDAIHSHPLRFSDAFLSESPATLQEWLKSLKAEWINLREAAELIAKTPANWPSEKETAAARAKTLDDILTRMTQTLSSAERALLRGSDGSVWHKLQRKL